jgi:hypothetical protein
MPHNVSSGNLGIHVSCGYVSEVYQREGKGTEDWTKVGKSECGGSERMKQRMLNMKGSRALQQFMENPSKKGNFRIDP